MLVSEECHTIDVDKLIKGGIVFIGQYKNCTTCSVALTCCQSLTANWTSFDYMSTPSHNALGHSPLGLSRHDRKLLVLWITNDNDNNHKLPPPHSFLPVCPLWGNPDLSALYSQRLIWLVIKVRPSSHSLARGCMQWPSCWFTCRNYANHLTTFYCGIFFICVTQTGENMLGWAWFYPLGTISQMVMLLLLFCCLIIAVCC